jgi:beta-glucosidase
MARGSLCTVAMAALATISGLTTPVIGGSNFPPSAYTQAAALLAKLNNTQKIALVHGFGQGIATAGYVGSTQPLAQFGIPPLNLEDGPQGVADLVPGATAYPSALTVAMTWDVTLAYAWGEAMGTEQSLKGTNVMLGPGTNLARVPWGGRVFEYFSGEDPVLGQKLLPAEIAGIQSNNIAANIKHFIMNNQVC